MFLLAGCADSAREFAPRAVFLIVVRPKMRCIMAFMDQKDSLLAVACARLVFAFGVCYTPWFDSGYMFAISLRGFLDEWEDFRILGSILVLLAANCGVCAVAVHRCRRHLCHCARAVSHGH